jgi:hypothetical protein
MLRHIGESGKASDKVEGVQGPRLQTALTSIDAGPYCERLWLPLLPPSPSLLPFAETLSLGLLQKSNIRRGAKKSARWLERTRKIAEEVAPPLIDVKGWMGSRERLIISLQCIYTLICLPQSRASQVVPRIPPVL